MNHITSYNEIGLHPEKCNNANNVKGIQKQNKKSLVHLFLVRLDICTDGTYQLDLILYGSEAEKHKRILFFQIKIKWSFSLVSDILFIRVGYRRQLQCILTFIKLALCIVYCWKTWKEFYIYSPEEHEEIPPIEILESFKYFITLCISILKKK